jgi:hypothetical protein
MYALPASLLCLPPPRRAVTRGKIVPAVQGRQPELLRRGRVVSQSCSSEAGTGSPRGNSLADFGRSKRAGDLGRSAPASIWCRGGDPALISNAWICCSIRAGSHKETYVEFTYEDDIKVNIKYVACISRTTYIVYIYLLKPSTGLPNLVSLSL